MKMHLNMNSNNETSSSSVPSHLFHPIPRHSQVQQLGIVAEGAVEGGDAGSGDVGVLSTERVHHQGQRGQEQRVRAVVGQQRVVHEHLQNRGGGVSIAESIGKI